MIEHWLGGAGRKAIEIMGRPEWREHEGNYSLELYNRTWLVRLAYTDAHPVPDHEALCLLREHARAWLESKAFISVRITCVGSLGCEVELNGNGIATREGDLDAALIKAITVLAEDVRGEAK